MPFQLQVVVKARDDLFAIEPKLLQPDVKIKQVPALAALKECAELCSEKLLWLKGHDIDFRLVLFADYLITDFKRRFLTVFAEQLHVLVDAAQARVGVAARDPTHEARAERVRHAQRGRLVQRRAHRRALLAGGGKPRRLRRIPLLIE